MQVTDSNGYIFGPKGLQVNGPDGKPKVISGGGGSGSIPNGTASGTDTYTVSITGVTSYADGDAYLVRFTNGNTTGATLNVNGLGAIPLYRNNDGQVIGGDIEDGAEMLCVYNSTLSVFQVIGSSPNTLLAYVTNAESITITKGQPVYAFGGQGDRLKVKLAYNTTDATSAQTVGLVLSASIGANQKGFIILNGQLDGLSILPTSTWADGDPVYLGPTAGSITNVKPSAPNHLVYLGFVTTANNGSAGRMYVRVQNGYEIEELHDVQISGLADNDIIQYDQATDLWQNKSLSNAGIQPTLSLTTTGSSGPATLTGSTLNIPQYGGGLTVGTTAITSGTVGRILFEGTGNVLQQSANLFWDNTNSRLGIGTATPSATLHSVGSITASAAIARGNYMQPTLVAAANNDTLVGLDIAPTFTNGAFTGVTNYGLRSSINYAGEYNGILIRNTNNTAGVGVSRFGLGNDANALLCGLNAFSSVYGSYLNNSSVLCTYTTSDLILATNFNVANSGTSSIRFFTGGYSSGQQRMQIFSTGNIAINTTTDAGYKLDVNGTARVQGMTTISGTFTNVPAISTTGFYIQPYSANNIVLGFNTYFNNSYKAISNGYIYYINQDAANFRLLGSTASVSAGLTSTMLTHFDFNNTESKLFNGKLNSNSSTYFDFLIGNGANLNTNFIKISYGAGSGYSHYFVSRHDASISSIQNQISLYLNNSTTATGSSAPNTGNVLNNTQSVISSTFFQPTLFKIGGSVTDTATSSAAVEIASTTRGFLPPRMTNAQMLAIAAPATGLVVYDTTNNKHCGYDGTAWQNFY